MRKRDKSNEEKFSDDELFPAEKIDAKQDADVMLEEYFV